MWCLIDTTVGISLLVCCKSTTNWAKVENLILTCEYSASNLSAMVNAMAKTKKTMQSSETLVWVEACKVKGRRAFYPNSEFPRKVPRKSIITSSLSKSMKVVAQCRSSSWGLKIPEHKQTIHKKAAIC